MTARMMVGQVQACLDASVERQRGGKDNDESKDYVDEADEIASGQQDPQPETEECQAADETGNGFGLHRLRLPPAVNSGYRCKQQGDANYFADDVQCDVVTDNQKDSECRQDDPVDEICAVLLYGKAPFYYSDCSFVLMGRMTVKVLPLVPSLSAETLPPNKSSICFTCARPRPLPSFLWAVSAW